MPSDTSPWGSLSSRNICINVPEFQVQQGRKGLDIASDCDATMKFPEQCALYTVDAQLTDTEKCLPCFSDTTEQQDVLAQ